MFLTFFSLQGGIFNFWCEVGMCHFLDIMEGAMLARTHFRTPDEGMLPPYIPVDMHTYLYAHTTVHASVAEMKGTHNGGGEKKSLSKDTTIH